tara:strand:- start:1378 stop:1623 length:246 start_codon:yes stop_codon:yes gene_type:complete
MFDCSKCGACCMAIGCSCFNTETKLCMMYDERPSICRVDVMVERKHKQTGIDKDTLYEMTYTACKVLQEQEGIFSEKFLEG